MDTIIEQVVKSKNYASERKRSSFILGLMVVFFVVFILLECFGLTVSQIYYYTDRELFWYFMLYFLLAAVPIVILEVILYVLRRRLCVTYDYSFDGTEFKIVKTVNEKRKKLACSFTVDSISKIGRVDGEGYILAFPVGEKRKPLICALNIDNPNIYYIKATAYIDGVPKETVIVIEPKKKLYDSLIFSCPHIYLDEKDAWCENK